MNTKHHTSQQISKQLAEAGIGIESEYGWVGFINDNRGEYFEVRHERDSYPPRYPAPIATEILENMPDGCEYGVNLVKLMSGYGVELTSYKTMPYDRLEFIQDKNPCDALALLLIRLTKDGLI